MEATKLTGYCIIDKRGNAPEREQSVHEIAYDKAQAFTGAIDSS